MLWNFLFRLIFNVIFIYCKDIEICPSSLAAYLDAAEFKVSECKPQLKQHQLFSSNVPQLNQEINLTDLVEWVGAAVLEIEWLVYFI